MATKFATDELQARMRRAVASIGRGTNQHKPEVELQGRRDLALVHIENQILLGRHLLTSEECQRLAELLFSTNDDDYTADAVETNAEATAPRTRQPVPDADGDWEDEEYDDEAEDL